MSRYLLLLSLLIIPHAANAAVLINEIAWMGSEASPNDEWIELYNDGESSVSLDGWVLTDNVSLDIVLAGTIAPGQHAVLERTDDGSAPGSAFMIYTGALSNGGRTLTLIRGSGSIEDQVAGGELWENIGGDNETKDTAQRTEGGWVTAKPTPGKANNTVASAPQEESASEARRMRSDEDADAEVIHVSLIEPDNELELSIEGPNRAYVNQEVIFEAEGSGINETFLDSLEYTWNYGDTYTGYGKKTSHRYRDPGTYVIVVRAEFNKYEAVARHEVTVLPVTFEIARADDDDILIHNNAKYEVNIGGYTLMGDHDVVFPPDTILLPNATLRISQERLESGSQKMLALYDVTGKAVASLLPSYLARASTKTEPNTDIRASTHARSPLIAANPSAGTFPDGSTMVAELPNDKTSDEIPTTANEQVQPSPALAASAASAGAGVRTWYLALSGLILLGILAVYSRRVV